MVSPNAPLAGGASAKGSAHQGPPLRLVDLPWSSIMTNGAFWAVLVAHSTFGEAAMVAYGSCCVFLGESMP